MTNEEIKTIAIQYELLRDKRHQVLKELSDLDKVLNKIKPILMRSARRAKKIGLIRETHYKVLDLRVRKGLTLEEVGNEFDVTRERIRQHEANALELLQQLNQKDSYPS